ncbi:GAF domain-containing sensor histidine kinase [Actinokineospora enzanensis]|uniref:GAF domain-containing sensor histidine kinase n=1 Tax=Actinokineospora enzanensis TaxID=155975 RepID=UPI0003755BB4|nr:sensor histidine kinase [Actinokineospora enzanensis]
MSESARLAELHEYGVLDAPADDELTAVVRAAAMVANVPTASLNLLDENRQCQLTTIGFEGGDSPREESMCQTVVLGGHTAITADARVDGRFAANPWVTGHYAAVRFYASVPLITPNGHVLGTLCVFDDKPKELATDRLSALEDLANVVVALFERRRQARSNRALAAEADAQRALAEDYSRELEVRQELTDAVHETIEVAIVACDSAGHLTLFNRAAREWHGLDPDANLDPAEWSDRYSLYAPDGVTLLAPEDVPLLRALREGRVDDVEMVIAPHGRPAVHVLCNGRALRAADGTRLGAVVTMTDVTVERAHQQALADREQVLSTILDTAPDAFVATDATGVITAWNPAAQRMFGWTPAEVTGRPLTELIIPTHLADAHARGLVRRATTGEARLSADLVQVPARRRDGSELLVELSLAEFTWQGERRFHAFLRDVTEREAARQRLARANAELAAANDELDRFTAIVAHDLKSPLAAISGYAEVLTELAHTREQERPLSAITRAATRMNSMIEDLLHYAHASHEPLRRRPVDLNTLIDDLTTEIDAAGTRVEITHGPLPLVDAHPTLLRQVMANLLGNAVKYVAPEVEPCVRVYGEEDADWVTIRITDNGIGISPEGREQVFALFHREPTAGEYKGTGIGLSTCRRIVERHGGTIWVEPAPTGGTTVVFTLPAPTHTIEPAPGSVPTTREHIRRVPAQPRR